MDRVPIHNAAASTVNLAKAWLLSVDRKSVETSVPTATLLLWLETIVEQLGGAGELDAQARRAVMGAYTEISEAERARNEDQARGAG